MRSLCAATCAAALLMTLNCGRTPTPGPPAGGAGDPPSLVNGVQTFGTLAEMSVRFRDQNGNWPNSPTELKPLLTDAAIDIERIDQIVSFRITPRGLAFVNRKSNETAFVVGNESTKDHLVLTGELRPSTR